MNSKIETGIYPGLALGGVRFISKLTDQGGQGEVWLAEDLNLPRNVAAKVFSWQEGATDHVTTQKGWDHEAELWAKLYHHQNVAKLLKYEPHLIHRITESDVRHIKMFVIQLADASMSSAIRSNWPPPLQTLLRWMDEIASGLIEAHNANPAIIHCDIKPGNVLLYHLDGAEKYAAITDFGISRWHNEGTLKKWIGTPPYAAPELSIGRYSVSTDIYSLGMTYLHMLAGRKFDKLLRSRDDQKVFYRKSVILAFQELEENPLTKELLDLIEEMTSHPNTLTATIVRDRIRRLSKHAGTTGSITFTPPKDDVTAKLRLASNRYVWHPELHASYGEILYFFYLRGFMSLTNMRATISTLLDPLLHGRYCIYELFGEHDILIRAWIDSELGEVTSVIRSITATMSGRCRIMTVNDLHYLWTKSAQFARIEHPREKFEDLVSNTQGDDLATKLKDRGLILAEIEEVKPPRVKIFTHITSFSQRRDRSLFEEVNSVLSKNPKELSGLIRGISTYSCYCENEGESVIVKSHAKEFHATQRLAYFLHEKLADHRIRTDSFLAAESMRFQSDDGPFINARWSRTK